jgi:multidrug efflux pump
MNISAPFIARPIATTLLTMGLIMAGLVAVTLLPVSPMPNVDLPTISVQASMAGASPETMSTTVATPLERHLGTIADVDEMTSSSSVGSTRVTLQFGLDRNIDGAARDVQAAINAARADLPTALKSNPTYRKINPADAPIMILALTSDTLSPGQIYDLASTILQQKLSQVAGVGQVQVGGSSLPAVRVDLNPLALFKYGIGLEDVRAALAAANADAPKGSLDQGNERFEVATNDQATTAAQFHSLIVAYRNNAAVKLSDIANVTDGVEDVRNIGLTNGKPAILVILYRQPGANIIDTVDRAKAELPELQAALPPAIKVIVANDRTGAIRQSLRDVERTMLLSIVLVVMVVFLFLRNGRAALVPSVAVPLSLIGTFALMYVAKFSLDNLSLMALTVASGFVVDDAIVVLENITRHVEAGMDRKEAVLLGAREVGFTDEPLADRRIYSDSSDGRHCWRVFLRIRNDAVVCHHHIPRRVTHDHADDVPFPHHKPRGKTAGALHGGRRARLRSCPQFLRQHTRVGARQPRLHHADPGSHDRTQCRIVRHGAKGLFSQRRHRRIGRDDPG